MSATSSWEALRGGESPLPAEADVVVLGGGIVGASLAYHLAGRGEKSVVVLEQGRLAGGTTWHAAGLVGRLRTSNGMTRINKYSAELYAGLEAKTGMPTGWKQVGSLIVGVSEDRMIQLERTAAMSERFGVECEIVDPDRVRELWPFVKTDDIRGGAWLPADGKVRPELLTRALAKGATDRGAQVFESVRVKTLEIEHGRVRSVVTEHGTIRCETAVLCGGMWTREFALPLGVSLPLSPVEHHYIVSEPIEGVSDDLPVGRDPDAMIYFRSEADSIMLGAFQKHSTAWLVDRVPAEFSFQLLDPDWKKYEQPLAAGLDRIPVLQKTKFPKFVNGPESFTPDNNFLLGETAEVRQLFVACGFNSVGIASAGGAGQVLAEWIDAGEAPMDLWSVDVRRFSRHHNNREFLRERTAEVLGLHYQMAWPNREMETGRNLRRSALHERLEARGACFGAKAGWERPNWFAAPGERPETEYSFGRQNWATRVVEEQRATRERVALFDQSSFSKLIVKGRDASRVLQHICGNDVDVDPGRVVYTGVFNSRGRFKSDLTVARLSEHEYLVITATSQATHDMDWIERKTPVTSHASVVDVTSAYGVIGVMGPRSRDLLSRVSDADLSNETFPFGAWREIAVGRATARALRITYVGELGWELHVPTEQMQLAYDALVDAGKDLDLAHAGHYAINAMRLEKGYRAWGHDISPDDSPLEAGLGFAIAWDKPGGFIGREALVAERERGLPRRLALFVLEDPDECLWGSEPIHRDGKPVGYTTSGAHGATIGAAIGMGYVNGGGQIVDNDFLLGARYEIIVAGRRVPARISLRPLHDPARKRILA